MNLQPMGLTQRSPNPRFPTLRVIGLTGGIATGKTKVSQYLAEVYQLPILDADIYARMAVEPGSPGLDAIAQRYGSAILLPDGQLNRTKLAEIIFTDAAERRWVEAQIHPWVRDRLIQDLTQLDQSGHGLTVVAVVPLLVEAQMTDLVTEIWLVDCPLEQQRDRLMQRNTLTLEQAEARINSQMPVADKCARVPATIPCVILDNSSTLDHLYEQIDMAIGAIASNSSRVASPESKH